MSYNRPSIGPMNRPPPWRRGGFHSLQGSPGIGSYTESPGFHYEYATAGLGALVNMAPAKSVRQLQTDLVSKGFSVGSTGADGIWGANTRRGLETVVGRSVAVASGANWAAIENENADVYVAGARGSQQVRMPLDWWYRIDSLPNRGGGGTSAGTPGTTTPGTTTRPPGGTTIGPGLDPSSLPDVDGPGFDWGASWPWLATAGGLLAVGGYFVWQGSRKRRPATTAAVTANRRRRGRRRRRSRG